MCVFFRCVSQHKLVKPLPKVSARPEAGVLSGGIKASPAAAERSAVNLYQAGRPVITPPPPPQISEVLSRPRSNGFDIWTTGLPEEVNTIALCLYEQ